MKVARAASGSGRSICLKPGRSQAWTRDVPILVARRPEPGVLCAGQAQEGRAGGRPCADRLRRCDAARRHVESRWRDPSRRISAAACSAWRRTAASLRRSSTRRLPESLIAIRNLSPEATGSYSRFTVCNGDRASTPLRSMGRRPCACYRISPTPLCSAHGGRTYRRCAVFAREDGHGAAVRCGDLRAAGAAVPVAQDVGEAGTVGFAASPHRKTACCCIAVATSD